MNTVDREAAYFFHTYKRIPLEIERGEGVYLFAKGGTRYLDMFSGLAVNALGYNHPKVVQAIQEQSRKYIHLSNYFLQEPQIRLAELLVKHTGFSKVFFCNSGTEATEAAIKVVRKWGKPLGKNEIVSFTHAFHGRTMGALSIMDREKYRDGYEPFLDNCFVVEYNEVAALERIVNEKTAAVFIECIQGEGGISSISPEFARAISSLQEKHGFLLVADEIQSGLGRTGTVFGFEHFGLKPDLVTIAKPLGGGLPLGAILGGPKVANVLSPGVHGTTFGGNPVACAAGIVVLEEIFERGIIQNAVERGKELHEAFHSLKTEFPSLITEVRGYGLMAGLNLSRDGEEIVTVMRDTHHILINCTAGTVLRFLPPLIITTDHITQTINALRETFHAL